MTRTFEARPAVRERVPLLIGLTGASSSGKTFSALRLATGIATVVGGEIFFIDTENRRALHYADRFKFRHVDFQPPFGPLDYLAAIEACVAQGARVIVIDSATHEHSGPGGVMDQSEEMLSKKCGDDWKCREKNLMLSLVKPKAQRKRLNAEIVRLGVDAIFCYRAQDKIKPRTGQEPEHLGWQPETTSPLHYEMTARFLLPPGSEGKPDFKPEYMAEVLATKMPAQFQGWFKPGVQLTEDIGARLATWAAGGKSQPAESPAPAAAPASGEKPASTRVDPITAEMKRLGWKRQQAELWLQDFFGVKRVGALKSEVVPMAVEMLKGLEVGKPLGECPVYLDAAKKYLDWRG